MAAGLPILANDTHYVRHLVETSKAGLVINFSNPQSIKKTILWFIENRDLRLEMGRKARIYFENEFNWNKVSVPMYAAIKSLVSDADPEALRVFPEQIQKDFYFSVKKLDSVNKSTAEQPSLRLVQEVGSELKKNIIHKIALTQSLQLIQNLWKLLPEGFRYKFGPKLRRRLRFFLVL